jgi:hypothetical protein
MISHKLGEIAVQERNGVMTIGGNLPQNLADHAQPVS